MALKLLANNGDSETAKTKIISFEAAISDSSSAIKMSGGAGDALKLSLDCYCGSQIEPLANLRGKNLMVVIGPVADMLKLTEFIGQERDHD